MSIDTLLRSTTPTDLPPVDHDRIQRAGLRRRWGTRVVSATAVVAVVAGAGLGLAQLGVHDATPSVLGSAEEGVDGVDGSASDGAPSPEPTTEPPTGDPAVEEAVPDQAVVDDFADLSHDEVVALLAGRLAETPERPSDLVSITVYGVVDGDDKVEELLGNETAEDFPVISVIHADFDPSREFETPAVQPTWDRRAAELALAALGEHRAFAGVEVDALGRTVAVFASPTSGQYVHVDPASGYTSGILFAAEEWGVDTEG